MGTTKIKGYYKGYEYEVEVGRTSLLNGSAIRTLTVYDQKHNVVFLYKHGIIKDAPIGHEIAKIFH